MTWIRSLGICGFREIFVRVLGSFKEYLFGARFFGKLYEGVLSVKPIGVL